MYRATVLAALASGIAPAVYRTAGLAFYSAIVLLRLWLALGSHAETRALWWPLWAAETAIFALIAVAYLRRRPMIRGPSTAAEILLPAIGGPLPFALSLGDVSEHGGLGEWSLLTIMLLGDAVSASGYLYLGGSYGLFVAARPLRTRGPYAMIRHPIYLGQLIVTLAVVALRWSPRNLAIGSLFACIQFTRAVLEERALAKASAGYAAYRAKTWMFVPLVL